MNDGPTKSVRERALELALQMHGPAAERSEVLETSEELLKYLTAETNFGRGESGSVISLDDATLELTPWGDWELERALNSIVLNPRQARVFGRALAGEDRLVVMEHDGRFFCAREGAVGAVAQGDGASPVEAVGSWAIYSGAVNVICEPPELLDTFQVGRAETPALEPAPRRE